MRRSTDKFSYPMIILYLIGLIPVVWLALRSAPYFIADGLMGILENAGDIHLILMNSPMENFFGKMKNEMFYGHEYEFKTLEQLQKAMEDYIEYYNNERIQVKLKGLTPCQARNQSLYSF